MKTDTAIRGAIGYEQDASLRTALLVVLNLHKPVPLGTHLGDDPPLECLECIEAAGASAAWPCPTVRGIATALGVEADRG